MGLEEKALDLAAFDLLLGLDLMERGVGGRWRMLARTPQILIGILWIPFGIWVIIAHAGIPITALMFGSVLAVSGGVKLWRFVNSHPVLTEREA
jgi:hypothetical protein